jgi:PST family polysaccharide transporter
LIQKKDIDEEYKSTAFWAIAGMGIGIFIFCFLSAPLLGRFFHNSGVIDVFRVLALTSLLSPFGAVQWALVTRELNFRSLALRNFSATVLYGVTAVVLAYSGFGVWALVFAALVREAAWSVLFWIIHDWRPGFRCNLDKLKEMARFSFGCIGSGTLNYAMDNLDAAIVGKYLGPANLGQYNLAMNLVSQPQAKLVSQITSIAFPVFSQLQEDLERMRGYYLKTLKVILVVVTPFLAILCASAHDFIVTVYGPKWEPAVIPVQIMCVYGFIKTISSIAEPVFLSQGRAGVFFKISMVRFACFIPSILYGVRYGIVGASWAILGYSVISSIPLFLIAHRSLKMSGRIFYIVIFKYAAAFLFVYGSMFLIRKLLIIYPVLGLTLSILAGGSVYFVYTALLNKEDAVSLWTLLKKAVKK